MKNIIDKGCSMAHDALYCPAYGTINQQTYLSLLIVGIFILMSIFLLFSKPRERTIVKTKIIEKQTSNKIFDTHDLTSEEKHVFVLLQKHKAFFQADLIEKIGFGKTKMTRVLDLLEGKGFVERKRLGMTNVVVLME